MCLRDSSSEHPRNSCICRLGFRSRREIHMLAGYHFGADNIITFLRARISYLLKIHMLRATISKLARSSEHLKNNICLPTGVRHRFQSASDEWQLKDDSVQAKSDICELAGHI